MNMFLVLLAGKGPDLCICHHQHHYKLINIMNNDDHHSLAGRRFEQEIFASCKQRSADVTVNSGALFEVSACEKCPKIDAIS